MKVSKSFCFELDSMWSNTPVVRSSFESYPQEIGADTYIKNFV